MLSDAELKRIAHQTEIKTLSIESLRKFANAIRADEREACARVCEEQNAKEHDFPISALVCAAAIRAREENE